MFNLQGSEIIVILLLALVVLGPEKLPDAIRRFSRTYNELKKMGSGFQSELKSALDEPMREMRETAEMVRDAADPDRVAATADAERPVAQAGDPPLVDSAADAAGSHEPAAPVTESGAGPNDAVSRSTAPDADRTEPGPANGPTDSSPPARVNQIAAANSSSAIAARPGPADGESSGGDGDAAAVDGETVASGPAFHSAAPRRTAVVDDAPAADDTATGAVDDSQRPAGDADADPAPVESSDETATA